MYGNEIRSCTNETHNEEWRHQCPPTLMPVSPQASMDKTQTCTPPWAINWEKTMENDKGREERGTVAERPSGWQPRIQRQSGWHATQLDPESRDELSKGKRNLAMFRVLGQVGERRRNRWFSVGTLTNFHDERLVPCQPHRAALRIARCGTVATIGKQPTLGLAWATIVVRTDEIWALNFSR